MKTQSFLIYGDIKLDVAISVKAENLEAALVEARKLKPTDFVEILGDYNDGEVDIRGVYKH